MRNAFVRNSKNLIDADILVSFGAEKVGENEYYVARPSELLNKRVWENTENYAGQLVFSFEVSHIQEDANNTNNGSTFRLYYTDGTRSPHGVIPNNSGYGKLQIVSTAGKVVSYIDCSYGTGSTKSYLKNIMLNKGTKALPYAPPHRISQVKALAVARNPANLIPFPNNTYFNGHKLTQDGITYTVQKDGGIHMKGVVGSRGYSYFQFYNSTDELTEGVSILSCFCDNKDVEIRADYENGTSIYATHDNPVVTDGSKITKLYVMIRKRISVDASVFPILIKNDRNPKNLIPFPYDRATDKTVEGIRFTQRNDGSVKVVGTATGYATYPLSNINLQGETKYYISVYNITGCVLCVLYDKGDGTTGQIGSYSTQPVRLPVNTTSVYAYLQVNPGDTVDAVVYPGIFVEDSQPYFVERIEPYFKIRKFKIDCKEV